MSWLIGLVTLPVLASIVAGVILTLRPALQPRRARTWFKGALAANLLLPLAGFAALMAFGIGEVLARIDSAVIETLTAFVANTLSFLRVAAFSLNHVALALAIFAMAEQLSTPGHWVMVVFGNLFVLVLEGAIVAIQALRLEYYEGFSRFFTGDGREFRPLTISAVTLK